MKQLYIGINTFIKSDKTKHPLNGKFHSVGVFDRYYVFQFIVILISNKHSIFKIITNMVKYKYNTQQLETKFNVV